MELCPDAPGDNDLRPGTWTSRHRSRIVSDRNLAKSNPNNETTATTRLVQCAVTSGADRLRSLADSGESRNFLKLLFVDFKVGRSTPRFLSIISESHPFSRFRSAPTRITWPRAFLRPLSHPSVPGQQQLDYEGVFCLSG